MFLPNENEHPRDFDFFHGRWAVSHRRLRKRLANCTDWDHFQGRCVALATMGGFGNVDDNIIDLPSGRYRAATIRAYDPQKKSWSIWWLDSRAPGEIGVPVVGRFHNGIGTFCADEMFENQQITVRFLWTAVDPAAPMWEQAFSPDGGKTWETNWEMRFRPEQ